MTAKFWALLVFTTGAGILGSACIEGRDPGWCDPACGTNSYCDFELGLCRCTDGWADRNYDNGVTVASDGCETEICDYATANSCGLGRQVFCNLDGECEACPTWYYDCDGYGYNGCEQEEGCDFVACDPLEEWSCYDADVYCDVYSETCETCPGGAQSYNCDGVGLCESATSCDGGVCDIDCQFDDESLCTRDSYGDCVECTTSEHCEANADSTGSVCDTFFNVCVCRYGTDCIGKSTGHVCVSGTLSVCGCYDDGDCDSYMYCEKSSGELSGHCEY